MSYFECNLPHQAPVWLHFTVYQQFQAMLNAIHVRMEKLDDALKASGLDGATFSKHAKMLFDHRPESFDRCTAMEIAEFTRLVDDGVKAEPRMEWPNAMVVVDTAFVTTKEWESLRHFGIGGSEASVILGVSPYQTGTSLYHNKVGTPVKFPESDDSDWVFERGHILEDKVISAFCKTTGAKIVPETRMFASKTHPYCTANIDGIIKFSDGRFFVLEAKTTIADNWKAWESDKIPAHYVPQTRQYPAVLNDDRICGTYISCIFTHDQVLNGTYLGSEYDDRKFVCRFVPRDQDAEEAQLLAEEEWFNEYVTSNEEPPMTGKPYDARHPEAGELQVLRRITGPADKSKPVEKWEADEYETDIQLYLETKEKMAELQKKLDKLDEAAKTYSAPMIARLGTATEAQVDLGDGTYYEVKNAPRPRTTIKMDQLSMLFDAIAPYLPTELHERLVDCIDRKAEAFRVFSIKQKKLRAGK